MVQHKSFNVNGQSESGWPNLLIAIILCADADGQPYGPRIVSNIQCMLNAGADPELEHTGLPHVTAMRHARSELRKEAVGSTKAKTWKRLIQMMEAAVATRDEIGGNYRVLYILIPQVELPNRNSSVSDEHGMLSFSRT